MIYTAEVSYATFSLHTHNYSEELRLNNFLTASAAPGTEVRTREQRTADLGAIYGKRY